MVEVNIKLLVFAVMMNAFLIGMFAIMPPDITAKFTGVKNIDTGIDYADQLPADDYNGTEVSMTEFTSGGWSAVWGFIKFMALGGIITVEGLPVWFSIPVVALFWVINIMVLLDLIGYVRELIGFT